MAYSEQTTLTNNTFITAELFNAFGTNIIDHNTRLNTLISGGGDTNVSIGMIFMWFGNPSELSDTWHVCDGTGGTPDLRDVLILGAGNTYSVGQTGGRSSHNHTIPTSGSGGGHSHSYSFTSGSQSSTVSALGGGSITEAGASHSHTAPSKTTATASSHTHSTPDTYNASLLPPYKAIYYIMRVK
jgi:hypothetical protein